MANSPSVNGSSENEARASAAGSAVQVIREALDDGEVSYVEHAPGVFEVDLPGERKLTTTCRMHVEAHSLGVHAFVARHPDENFEGVYQWLLEQNLKLYGVAFAVDAAGDIYLDGRLPLHAVTNEEIDRLLGSVLNTADDSFNTILELGFATSIRREWQWRESRGESTKNLEAFRHLRPG